MPPLQQQQQNNNNERRLSAIEVRDAFDHPALFVFGEFGEHGQGQNLFRGALGFGKVAFAITEIHQTGLQR